MGHDLPGKVLGLVGCGRVGRCLAASAAALGMTVLSTNSSSSRCVHWGCRTGPAAASMVRTELW